MRTRLAAAAWLAAFATVAASSEPTHVHPPPEKLGQVHFENTCTPAVRASFDRAVALLHSFAYDAARQEFLGVATKDPGCAIAHWGAAMSVYHQLWSPPDPAALQFGHGQMLVARQVGAHSAREAGFMDAAAVFFSDTDPAHHPARVQQYTHAMQLVAQHFQTDEETQVFYALALIAAAAPTDRSHDNQKRAAAILERVYQAHPDHPGAAHYLIHAYDSTELAPQGLPAARAYAKIAPAAPHALHMPSHIFTRLGLWDDSIASNNAARQAAREQGDLGEQLHAMDYLTYAYLQRGRATDAEQIVAQLHAMGPLASDDFKVSYAATAMPVRLAIEREKWLDAQDIKPLADSAPQVKAIAWWARALGHARSKQLDAARSDAAQIEACEQLATSRGDRYWASQVRVLSQEARAWIAEAAGQPQQALGLLQQAASAEDALEKLPVTPGPIVPAREQLGQLLLELNRPREALQELTQALRDAPGRRAALLAAERAARQSGDAAAAAGFHRLLAS